MQHDNDYNRIHNFNGAAKISQSKQLEESSQQSSQEYKKFEDVYHYKHSKNRKNPHMLHATKSGKYFATSKVRACRPAVAHQTIVMHVL